jgi:HK97 gp10 family phage protein
MGVEVSANLRGIERLTRGLSAQSMQQLLQRAGFEAEGLAKQKAPIDTGYLRSSIGAGKASSVEVPVNVGAEYGVYHELGTRYMKAKPYLEPSLKKAAGNLQAALEALFRSAS